MAALTKQLNDRFQEIELILCDVDGVLTDGGIVYDNQGIEIKRFHVRDGLGIRLWQRAGGHFAILTARTSHIVKVRAAELGISILRQGFDDKLSASKTILEDLDIEPSQACFIGDDLNDLAVMSYVGMGIAVADACAEVRDAADFVTELPGGHGAVREVIETILKARQRWQDLIRKYLPLVE